MRPFAKDEKDRSAKLVELMCCMGQWRGSRFALQWKGIRATSAS